MNSFVWDKFWNSLDILMKLYSLHNVYGKSWHSWLLYSTYLLHSLLNIISRVIFYVPFTFLQDRPVKDKDFLYKNKRITEMYNFEESTFENLGMWTGCPHILYYNPCCWENKWWILNTYSLYKRICIDILTSPHITLRDPWLKYGSLP